MVLACAVKLASVTGWHAAAAVECGQATAYKVQSAGGCLDVADLYVIAQFWRDEGSCLTLHGIHSIQTSYRSL